MELVETDFKEKLDHILSKFSRNRDNLIPILQEVQQEFGYLPEETMQSIADFLHLSGSTVYSVASFYSQFRFHRPGDHIIKVCLGTACHVKGGERIAESVERELGINGGETDADLQWTLETVGCLGACALGPIVVVDGEYHGQMTSVKATRLLQKVKKADGNGAG